MAFARSTIRHCQLLIATTLALGMLTTVSQAYTQEQEQMCASLSDGCKAVFRYEPPAATPVSYAPSAKPSKPLNLTPHKRG
jgi:hypothetical protein